MNKRHNKPRSDKGTPRPSPELSVLTRPSEHQAGVAQPSKEPAQVSGNDSIRLQIKRPEWWMVLATIAYVIVSGMQWKITRDTLTLSQRPWVGVKSEGSTLNLSPEGAADARITAANTGQTPAFRLTSRVQISK